MERPRETGRRVRCIHVMYKFWLDEPVLELSQRSTSLHALARLAHVWPQITILSLWLAMLSQKARVFGAVSACNHIE